MNKACPDCGSWRTFMIEDDELGRVILCRKKGCKRWNLYPDEL